MSPQTLTLGSEALADFRYKMDLALDAALKTLKEKKLMEGVVNAKIKILMVEKTDKETGQVTTRINLEPDVNLKIGAKYKLECQEETGLLMAFNQEGNPVIATNQIDIDELLAEQKGA